VQSRNCSLLATLFDKPANHIKAETVDATHIHTVMDTALREEKEKYGAMVSSESEFGKTPIC
jgi:hypothetical protein